MATPTVPFKIMPDGYKVTGDMATGYTATVKYFMEWQYAFTFVDQIFARATVSAPGSPIQYHMPYRFPPAVSNLYANKFTLTPCGASGAPITSYGGLAPGEYFTHATVDVVFETLPYGQNSFDDPTGAQQLDPTNPLTMCEQSVKIVSKSETRKAGSFYYATTGKPVPTDFSIVTHECKLVLSFPNVPYLPWHLVKPFVGSINDLPILDCGRGTLLLEGMDTKVVQTNQGITQQVQLEFSENPFGDWNKLPDLTGVPVLVYRAGTNSDANRIYQYMDFHQIFWSLTFLPIS